MQKQALIKGEEYVLSKGHIGVYDGEMMSGYVTLYDGTKFYLSNGGLRFLVTDHETGDKRLVLVDTGRDVEESVTAKATREAKEAEEAAHRLQNKQDAERILESYGIEVKERMGFTKDNTVQVRNVNGTLAEVHIVDFTIGHLLQVVAQVEAHADDRIDAAVYDDRAGADL